MPRRRKATDELIRRAAVEFGRLPPAARAAVVAVAIVGGLIYLLFFHRPPQPPTSRPTPVPPATRPSPEARAPSPDGYLFCFWNIENLFDDVNDSRRPTDEEFDNPFAANARLRQLKYDRLASALLRLNGGIGPDIIACVEVESVRAAELLRDTLNANLPDPGRHYTQVAMVNLDAGRHIAPCLISRLPIDPSRTRLIAPRLRILEACVRVNGHDLVTVVSHWTSQVTQRGGGLDAGTGRGRYAAVIREAFNEQARRNPDLDYLLCGDFNDTPDSDPVLRILRATALNQAETRSPAEPLLIALMAGKPADRYGTLWFGGQPLIYDQFCVSAGMLKSRGWSCDPVTVRTVTDGLIRPGASRRQPWRFGNPTPPMSDADRGYSDHFPITIRLQVAPAESGIGP